MNKLRLAQIVFALSLVASNWFLATSYDREIGLQEKSFAAAILGVIFAAGAVWFLGKRVIRLIRKRVAPRHFASNVTGGGLLAYWPTLFLSPLLLQFETRSLTLLPDGVRVTHVFVYGTDLTLALLILGAISIALFQWVTEMESLPSAAEQRVLQTPRQMPAPGSV